MPEFSITQHLPPSPLRWSAGVRVPHVCLSQARAVRARSDSQPAPLGRYPGYWLANRPNLTYSGTHSQGTGPAMIGIFHNSRRANRHYADRVLGVQMVSGLLNLFPLKLAEWASYRKERC